MRWRTRFDSRSRPARTGRAATTSPTATWSNTTSTSSSTSATTRTSTQSAPRPAADSGSGGFQRGNGRSANVSPAPYAVQARPGSPSGARQVSVRGRLGRPRSGERLFRAGARIRVAIAGIHGAPRGGLPGVLRTHADPPVASRRSRVRAADLSPAAIRTARRVHDAGRPAVPLGQPMRRRRVAAMRRRHSSGDYTMLGREQERWLTRGFARSSARWNIVGQQLLVAELDTLHDPAQVVLERRVGRLSARAQTTPDVRGRTKVRNPVFLTGDWHSTFVNDLKLDFKDPSPRRSRRSS